jgi:hypothetical protein
VEKKIKEYGRNILLSKVLHKVTIKKRQVKMAIKNRMIGQQISYNNKEKKGDQFLLIIKRLC